MRKFHAAFFLCFISCLVHAQSSSIWFSAQAPLRIKNWEWHQDVGYRTIGSSSKATLWLYRTGVRRYFSEHWNAAAGYALFSSRVEKEKPAFGAENRIWEEVVRQDQWGKLKWMQRIRIEQRWFDATTQTPYYAAHRFRYRTAFIQALTPQLDLQVYDEIMVQSQKGQWFFNQNRTGFFLHIKPSKKQVFNLGYTYLHQPLANTHLFLLGYQHNMVR